MVVKHLTEYNPVITRRRRAHYLAAMNAVTEKGNPGQRSQDDTKQGCISDRVSGQENFSPWTAFKTSWACIPNRRSNLPQQDIARAYRGDGRHCTEAPPTWRRHPICRRKASPPPGRRLQAAGRNPQEGRQGKQNPANGRFREASTSVKQAHKRGTQAATTSTPQGGRQLQ